MYGWMVGEGLHQKKEEIVIQGSFKTSGRKGVITVKNSLVRL